MYLTQTEIYSGLLSMAFLLGLAYRTGYVWGLAAGIKAGRVIERKQAAPLEPAPAPQHPPIIGHGTPEEFAAAMKKWMVQDTPQVQMFKLVCRLASCDSQTPEAFVLLVKEAKGLVRS